MMIISSQYGAAVVVACTVIVLTWAWKLLNWVWFSPRKLEKELRKQGLHGSCYRLLYGDMKDLFRMRDEAREKPMPSFTNDYFTRVLPFQHQLVKTHGRNSFSWLGPVPVINITEPELIREVFTKMYEFKKPKLNPLIGLLVPGLVSYEGEKWAMHRRLINPAFHMEKLKLMLPAMSAGIIETSEKWERIMAEADSCEIDVWPYCTDISAEVISRAAFGSSYEEGRSIFELLKAQAEITVRLFTTVYVPGWKYMPTKTNNKMKHLNAEIQTLLKGMIDKRRKAMDAGEPAKDDLLGILMDSNFKETEIQGKDKKQRVAMTFQDMIEECKLFYFAGQETTSVWLVWSLILLAKYQDWQTRAREEVLATFGKNQPDYDGLNHLKIVTMILHEVLRLYPPVMSVSRRVYDQEARLGNFAVPPGAMVSLQILQVHHDPKLWGTDVTEFKPERFSEGIIKATNGNLSYFPFTGGPRICIGQNFATTEAKLVLCMILQRYSFELSPSYAHAPSTFVTLRPQHGAPLILHRL